MGDLVMAGGSAHNRKMMHKSLNKYCLLLNNIFIESIYYISLALFVPEWLTMFANSKAIQLYCHGLNSHKSVVCFLGFLKQID